MVRLSWFSFPMNDSNNPPPPSPSGQPQDPYGQPAANPYGQPPQQPQYGGAPAYGSAPPYGQQAYNPQAAYGQPVDPDKRPGTITAAGVITLIMSGITLILFVVVAIGLAVARDDVVDELKGENGLEDIDPNDLVSVLIIVVLVFAVWCLAAMVLAVFAMRGSNVARILLVISAGMTALVSLLLITAFVTAISFIAAIAVIVLLFVGNAGDWYARNGGPASELPVGTTQPWS